MLLKYIYYAEVSICVCLKLRHYALNFFLRNYISRTLLYSALDFFVFFALLSVWYGVLVLTRIIDAFSASYSLTHILSHTI